MADIPPISQSVDAIVIATTQEVDLNYLRRSSTRLILPEGYNSTLTVSVPEAIAFGTIGVIFTPTRSEINISVPEVFVIHTSDNIGSSTKVLTQSENLPTEQQISTADRLQEFNNKNIFLLYEKLSKVGYNVNNVNSGDQRNWSQEVIANISDRRLMRDLLRISHMRYNNYTLREEANNNVSYASSNNPLTKAFRNNPR